MQTKPIQQRVPKILVVDDSQASISLLTRMLRKKGYQVRPAPSGTLALEIANKMPPDLILLDIKMPCMDGYEVFEALQANPALKGIPVIFLSALDDTMEKVKALQVGGVDYVSKPFQFEELEARVRTHLELHWLRQNLEREVGLRTYQLQQSKDRLAILDKAKSDFLTLISHELRTPLNGLFLIGESLLEEDRSKANTKKLRELFRHSRRRIMTIVEDALLLTQVDAQIERLSQMPTSLKTVLLKAIENCKEVGKIFCVGISATGLADNNCTIFGEEMFLCKAFEALLETAFKFSMPNTNVCISISAFEAHGEVWVEIVSKGRAIPQQCLSRFFDVLAIAEAIVPGGDLGLRPAGAERILTLFGGAVAVENIVSPGICFKIRLSRIVPACFPCKPVNAQGIFL